MSWSEDNMEPNDNIEPENSWPEDKEREPKMAWSEANMSQTFHDQWTVWSQNFMARTRKIEPKCMARGLGTI
jgi:hypothetical protein